MGTPNIPTKEVPATPDDNSGKKAEGSQAEKPRDHITPGTNAADIEMAATQEHGKVTLDWKNYF